MGRIPYRSKNSFGKDGCNDAPHPSQKLPEEAWATCEAGFVEYFVFLLWWLEIASNYAVPVVNVQISAYEFYTIGKLIQSNKSCIIIGFGSSVFFKNLSEHFAVFIQIISCFRLSGAYQQRII